MQVSIHGRVSYIAARLKTDSAESTCREVKGAKLFEFSSRGSCQGGIGDVTAENWSMESLKLFVLETEAQDTRADSHHAVITQSRSYPDQNAL